MADSVFKKLEIVGTSSESFDDATAKAVAKAGETISGMSWFEVVELRGAIDKGKVKQYQATIRIGYKAE
jgi:flavin-binding protein dodecin